MAVVSQMPSPQTALEMYTPLVEGNDQAVPILLYAGEEAVVPIALTGVPVGEMQEAVRGALRMAKERFGPASWVIHNNEAYMRAYDLTNETDAQEMENFQRGDYQREARSVGTERLQDVAVIVGISADGEAWQLIAPFVRNLGVVTWGEVMLGALETDAGIPQILLHAVR